MKIQILTKCYLGPIGAILEHEGTNEHFEFFSGMNIPKNLFPQLISRGMLKVVEEAV